MPSKKKKLTFTVQNKEGLEAWHSPRWQEAEVEDATCPNCAETMTVVMANQDSVPFIYAHCAGPKGCGRYFIGG